MPIDHRVLWKGNSRKSGRGVTWIPGYSFCNPMNDWVFRGFEWLFSPMSILNSSRPWTLKDLNRSAYGIGPLLPQASRFSCLTLPRVRFKLWRSDNWPVIHSKCQSPEKETATKLWHKHFNVIKRTPVIFVGFTLRWNALKCSQLFLYPPSSGIASCIWTAGTVHDSYTWRGPTI